MEFHAGVMIYHRSFFRISHFLFLPQERFVISFKFSPFAFAYCLKLPKLDEGKKAGPWAFSNYGVFSVLRYLLLLPLRK